MKHLMKHRVKITIVNVPGSHLPHDHGPFTFVAEDGCDLSRFADGAISCRPLQFGC